MKCPHCGYTNPEDMFRCPRCRKFMDPELNLIDDIDKAIYDYEHNTPKKQVQRQNYGKYHVSTYDYYHHHHHHYHCLYFQNVHFIKIYIP